ncbi:MAG: choice-of-anchor R domain-containing protein [Planctomycetota bacterium]
MNFEKKKGKTGREEFLMRLMDFTVVRGSAKRSIIILAVFLTLVCSPTRAIGVGSNLVATSSTNVTNATGGSTSIMGTQDNTEIYVPPFSIAGADDTQALTLTIERYGDPGDAVEGTDASSVSAVYDFKFDDEGVSIDENHTFTVTMSFQLPPGMTHQEFEDSLVMQYIHVGDPQWKTDGISNVRINWVNSTIIFDVSHLSLFAAFVEGEFCHPADTNCDNVISMLEILGYIDQWAAGEVSISDVVQAINLWAAGSYHWDPDEEIFKPGNLPTGPYLYEYHNTGDNDIMDIADTKWIAQTFTVGTLSPNVEHEITSVKLLLYRLGNPGTITVSIRAVDGNKFPVAGGGDLISATINGDSLTTDPAGNWYTIEMPSYNLQPSTMYAIVVRAAESEGLNELKWRYDYPAYYKGGLTYISYESGDMWMRYNGDDMMFEVWGN